MFILKVFRKHNFISFCSVLILFFIIFYFIDLLRNNCLRSAIYQYEILEEYLIDNEPDYDNSDENQKSTKYILLWTKFFGKKKWSLHKDTEYQDYFEKFSCPETDCVITNNKHLIKQHLFDAIIFHGAETWDLLMPPKLRSPHQVYVMASGESPAEIKHKLELDHDFYNLSMTYRLDSDILWPYNQILDIKANAIVAPSKHVRWRNVDDDFSDEYLLELADQKSKDIAWFVSHCDTISKRDQLAKELKKYIDVDIFGKCGTLSCPRGATYCKTMLNSTYRFYAAFENSLCEDYVTEKFFEQLQNNIVPIVYGGANYSYFAPPKSFINANDFETVEDLANYLNYLAENPKEYIKYFWWKKYYKVVDYEPYCSLCTLLHGNNFGERKQFYKDIRGWFFKNACKRHPNIKF